MKGSSGVAEVGVNFRPDANSRWKVDANVQGHFGQGGGVQGMLAFNYRF